MEHPRTLVRPQWVYLQCRCGHRATVLLPPGPWRHRDWILPRAICTACGRRGADHLTHAEDPSQPVYGLWTGGGSLVH